MKSVQYYLLVGVTFFFALLPLRFLYLISDLFYFILYYLVRYRKEVVFSNLSNSFPEKSPLEIEKIARKFYKHLCDVFVESLKMLHTPLKESRRRFHIKNPEILDTVYKDNKIVFIALGHYNNWEWTSFLNHMPDMHCVSLYRPLHNTVFDRYMLKLRSMKGSTLVQSNNLLRFLGQWNQPDVRLFLGFITDQSPLMKDIHYWTKFLNQDTPVFMGIEKLAVRLNVPVGYFSIQKVKRGYYEVELIPITNHPAETSLNEITEAHTRLLEKDILRNPEYWLWSHRRWKRKPKLQ